MLYGSAMPVVTRLQVRVCLFNTLKDATLATWSFTARVSIGVSVVTSAILALAGFFQFRGVTHGNVLNNYSQQDEVVNFSRVLYAITMVLTYPMEIVVARHCVFAVAQKICMRAPSHQEVSYVWHALVTIGIFLLTLAVGLSTDDLGIVLEITGSVSATVLGFIMPAALYFRLTPNWRDALSNRAGIQEPAAACALGLFGVVVFVCSSLLTLMKML